MLCCRCWRRLLVCFRPSRNGIHTNSCRTFRFDRFDTFCGPQQNAQNTVDIVLGWALDAATDTETRLSIIGVFRPSPLLLFMLSQLLHSIVLCLCVPLKLADFLDRFPWHWSAQHAFANKLLPQFTTHIHHIVIAAFPALASPAALSACRFESHSISGSSSSASAISTASASASASAVTDFARDTITAKLPVLLGLVGCVCCVCCCPRARLFCRDSVVAFTFADLNRFRAVRSLRWFLVWDKANRLSDTVSCRCLCFVAQHQ